jgi:hypothetical protein
MRIAVTAVGAKLSAITHEQKNFLALFALGLTSVNVIS